MLCVPWPRSGRLLRHFLFFPPFAAEPIGASGCQGCVAPSGARPGLDAGASGDYIAWPSKEEKTPLQPAAASGCQGTHGRTERPPASPAGPLAAIAGALALLATRQHTARIKDRSSNHGAQRPARGVGARLPPRWPPAHACAASGTCAHRLSPVTRRACDSGPPTPRLAWPALWPALAASPRWPSCWCAPRGRALTQEPSGITVRTLARREERPQRTSGRSGTAADLQERSDWQSPRAGVLSGVGF